MTKKRANINAVRYRQTTDWNEQSRAGEWRGAWAEICNQFLERGNHAERIDHRSYSRQGIDQMAWNYKVRMRRDK